MESNVNPITPLGYIVMVTPGIFLQELDMESYECTSYWRQAHMFENEELAISAANHVDAISKINDKNYMSNVFLISQRKIWCGMYKED